ncbi:MAG: hypothetical protein FD135_1813 [Comamonadaceae bacterium]|nr:MAG: hypothetical protein FD135_1813 [Comamonadaceae bacterium]
MGQLLLTERTDGEINKGACFGRQQFLADEVELNRLQAMGEHPWRLHASTAGVRIGDGALGLKL